MLTGTIVNTLAVLAGTALGRTILRRLPGDWQESALKAVGLIVVLIGVATALPAFAHWTVIIILATVGGALIGEALRLEDRMKALESTGEHLFGTSREGVARAALAGTVLFCAGPLAILGSMQEGLGISHATLLAKAALDGLTSVALAATLGAGVVLAALPVFLYQGSIAVLARLFGHGMSSDAMTAMSGVGGALILAIGLNMLGAARLRVASLLPAVVLAPLGAWLAGLR